MINIHLSFSPIMQPSNTQRDVTELTNWDQIKTILNDSSQTIHMIDFYTTWCGPCKRIAPEIVRLANATEFQSVSFWKLDAENESLEEFVATCQIEAFPTFCFFRAGKVFQKTEGGPAGKIATILNNALSEQKIE